MDYKKFLLSLGIVVAGTAVLSAGAPPTVMFLPDKAWCDANGFITASEHNGRTRYTEEYEAAFRQNTDLKNVVVQLNGLMKDNGLPAKDYGTASELDDEEEAEEELYEGENGAVMEMTPYEAALSKLRPDIIIKVGWDVNKVGFNYTLTYRMEALDSYSGKSVAQVTGDSPTLKTTTPVATALKTVAMENMPLFISRLQEHFDDIQANGREITVACRLAGGTGLTFNTEMGGKELSTIITDWMNDNTVNHAYSTRSATRNRMSFEQVRIPFKDSAGRVMQAKEFVDQLKRYLRDNCGLGGENTTKGLGSGRLYNIATK